MILSLILSSSLLSPVATAAETPEAAIVAMEKERTAAFVRKDMEKLRKMTPADYTVVNTKGALQKGPETLASLSNGSLKLDSDDLEDLEVRVYGDAAVLTGVANVKGESKGKKFHGRERFTRVYVKRDGSWVTVAYQTTPIEK